jgi:tRNA (adenine37-N6)-methyltransferase
MGCNPWAWRLENTMHRPFLATVAALTLAAAFFGRAESNAAEPENKSFSVHVIGQVQKKDGRNTIVLDKKYQKGLLGLDQFSHVYVIWWFDKNDTPQQRAILQVHPKGDRSKPLAGVFATRAPFRPNLIALSLCKIVAIKDNIVEVEKIDAFEGTPVLDLKPFAPGIDSPSDAKGPQREAPK